MGISASNAPKVLVFVALVVMASFLLNFATFIVVFFSSSGGGIAPAPSPVPEPSPTPEPTPLPTTATPTFAPTQFPTGFPTASPFAPPKCDNGLELGIVQQEEGDYIGLVWTSCPSDAVFSAFTAAASKWSSLIAESKLNPINFGTEFDVSGGCSFLTPFVATGIEVTESYILAIEAIEIDGAGGAFGLSSVCLADSSTWVPIFGGIVIDNDDGDALAELGILDDIAIREVGHTLGFSSLLFRLTMQDGGQAPAGLENDLVEDLVFGEDGTVDYTRSPQFIGTFASAVFSDLTGENQTSVPLQGAFFQGEAIVPFDNSTGSSIIDNHWDKDTIGEEVMTFTYDLGAPSRPLSLLTLAAMNDVGYVMNISLAEPYELPSAAAKNVRAPSKLISVPFEHGMEEIKFAQDVLIH